GLDSAVAVEIDSAADRGRVVRRGNRTRSECEGLRAAAAGARRRFVADGDGFASCRDGAVSERGAVKTGSTCEGSQNGAALAGRCRGTAQGDAIQCRSGCVMAQCRGVVATGIRGE